MRSPTRPTPLKLGEILALALESHGEVLKVLYTLFGEEVLIEVLERTDEVASERSTETTLPPHLRKCFMEDRRVSDQLNGPPDWSALLEKRVVAIGLPAVLGFYIWAYPPYRMWIESDLDLNLILNQVDAHDALPDSSQTLVADDWVNRADSWLSAIGLPEKIHQQVHRAAHPIWIRFRSRLLSHIGARRMSSL